MPVTSSRHPKSITKSPRTGKANNTLGSHWIGITNGANRTSPCLGMSRNHSSSLSIDNRPRNNMHLFNVHASITEPKSNMSCNHSTLHRSTRRVRNTPNKSAASFHFSDELLIQRFYVQSVPSHSNIQTQPKKHAKTNNATPRLLKHTGRFHTNLQCK